MNTPGSILYFSNGNAPICANEGSNPDAVFIGFPSLVGTFNEFKTNLLLSQIENTVDKVKLASTIVSTRMDILRLTLLLDALNSYKRQSIDGWFERHLKKNNSHIYIYSVHSELRILNLRPARSRWAPHFSEAINSIGHHHTLFYSNKGANKDNVLPVLKELILKKFAYLSALEKSLMNYSQIKALNDKYEQDRKALKAKYENDFDALSGETTLLMLPREF